MMENRAAFVRVGLLIVAGLGIMGGLIWFLGGTQIRNGLVSESYFRESVQGLEVGAPVKYRGVTVGRVTEIGLVAAEYNSGMPAQLDMVNYRMVLVRYLIDRAKLGRVPETAAAVQLGLRARLASAGITGVTYIELDFVDPDRYPAEKVPWHPVDAYIPSMPSTLSQVQDAAQQLLSRIDKVDIVKLSETLTALLTDLRTDLESGDIHLLLARSAQLLQALQHNAETADLPGLSADLKRTSQAYRALAEDKDIRSALASSARATERLAQATAQLAPLIQQLQSTTRRANDGTADVQQALVPVLRDMQATLANLRELTEGLRRNPSQLLTSQPPPRR